MRREVRLLLVAAVALVGGQAAVLGQGVPAGGVSRGEQLKRDVMSADAAVRVKARRDLINGEYRDLSDEERLAAIMSVISTLMPADQQSDSMQGILIEMLPRLAPSKASEALPLLLGYMGDPKVDAYIRGRAMFAAARIVPADGRVVAALIKVVRENPTGDMREAVEGLGLMGSAAGSARPALTAVLSDPSAELQQMAFISLGRILLDGSKGKDFSGLVGDMKASADERAAGHLQLRATGSYTHLSREKHTLTPEGRRAAQAALLTVLQRKKADGEARVALDTLGEIGSGSSPAMAQAILDNSEGFWGPYKALEAMEFTDEGTVPVLVSGLRRAYVSQGDWTMRVALAKGLAKYGSKGREILPDALRYLEKVLGGAAPDWMEAEIHVGLVAALGADVPGVSAGLMRLLDLTAGLKGKESQMGRVVIVKALFDAGLPRDASERKVVLARMIQEASGAEFAAIRGELVLKIPAGDLEPYAAGFAAQLTEVLKRPEPKETVALEAHLRESTSAVRGLAHLGKAAAGARPMLEEIASREFSPLMYATAPMLMNDLIRAAREAVKEK